MVTSAYAQPREKLGPGFGVVGLGLAQVVAGEFEVNGGGTGEAQGGGQIDGGGGISRSESGHQGGEENERAHGDGKGWRIASLGDGDGLAVGDGDAC